MPDLQRTKALRDNWLGKRDGTVFVEMQGFYRIVTGVVTSSENTFNLIIDTGSSYTWVGAREENEYMEGYASHPTSQIVNIHYGGGMVHLRAITYRDLLVLDDLAIHSQEIGIPIELVGFPPGLDGILGLGPSRLNDGIAEDGSTIPTVVENLFNQGIISYAAFGIYFVPRNVQNIGGTGLLSFGTIDTSVLTSGMEYVPVTQSFPANEFWGVDASISYENTPILLPTSGILDSGSCRILVVDNAFKAYQSATGAVIDSFDSNRRLIITQDQYDNLQTLSVLIGNQSYDLSPNAQIYPRTSSDQHIFLVVQKLTATGGLGFKLGSPFFERYYIVFNSTSLEIGFASHIHTQSTSN
ncbi:hypothetical protein ID866_9575 [Astraeus odoratus]|nr:hypothetical protein ID866_9575 [Astraeus odoratus]